MNKVRINRKILLYLLSVIIILSLSPTIVFSQSEDSTAYVVDSLFVYASSGDTQWRDLVEPSKKAISDMGNAAIPQMMTKLNTRDARETHTIVDIFKGIGEIAVDSLATRINDSDAFTRRLAIRCLGDIKSDKAVGPLISVKNHDDFRTRTGVMTALGKIGSSDGADAVMVGLSDLDELVATAAAVACGRIKEGVKPSVLIDELSHPYYGVRYSAMEALAELGEKSIKPLIDHIQIQSNSMSSGYAIEALIRIEPSKKQKILVKLINTDDWAIRAFSAEALGSIDSKKVRKALLKALKTEKHPFVIGKIKSSLEKLQAN